MASTFWTAGRSTGWLTNDRKNQNSRVGWWWEFDVVAEIGQRGDVAPILAERRETNDGRNPIPALMS